MIRVMLVHHMPLVHQALVKRFSQEADFQVVGCAATSADLLATLAQADCDMLVLDVKVAGANTLTVLRQMTQLCPTVKVLLLGLVEEPAIILSYIQSGAVGYVANEATADELIQQVRATRQGEALLSPVVATALIQRVAELSRLLETRYPLAMADREIDTRLTRQQQHILVLLEQGYSNQEIADKLMIGIGTVKNHVHAVMRKLKVKNRREAVAFKRSGFV